MKLVKKDYKKGFVKLNIQNMDDLWYLSTILDQSDLVSAQTERKIKIGGEDARNTKIVRKRMWLKINVEKIQFAKTTSALRISGKIAEGTDDIAAGDYHTLNIEPESQIDIDKGRKGFLKFQIDKIEDACKNTATSILVCALDRDQATVAQLKKYGYEIVSTIKGTAEKKDYKENITSNFFKDVAKNLDEIVTRLKITNLVIGSVAFWKDHLAKEIDKLGLKKKVPIVYTSCDSDGENAVREIMAQEEVKNTLKDERFSVETNLINQVLALISKNDKVAYGLKETTEAAKNGAVEKLLITDQLIMEFREEEKFERLDKIMRVVDKSNGDIVIISAEHAGGQQLQGLGGIAGILRFKL